MSRALLFCPALFLSLASLAGAARAQCPATGLARLSPPHFRPGEFYGLSLVLDGDQALIGVSHDIAPPSSGGAFFLQRRGDRWLRTGTLAPRFPEAGQGPGSGAALSGDWAALTSARFDILSRPAVVHLFRRESGRWSERQMLRPATHDSFGRFGFALSLDGTTLAVGDPGDDLQGPDEGSVSLFRLEGSAWVLEGVVLPPLRGWGFGGAIDLEGGRLLVGEADKAHVFRREGADWILEASLVGRDVRPGEGYGGALALHGERAIVGALRHRHGRREEGGAWIFRRTAQGWLEETELLPDPASAGSSFGRSVALDADRALVTAGGADTAYLFRRSDGSWNLEANLVAVEGEARGFGNLVALSGRNALVTGVPWTTDRGSLHAFDLCLPARADSRTAGANPAVLSVAPPVLGGVFRATVDCASSGHAFAQLFALDTPDERWLPRLGVLLARDGGSGALFVLGPRPGPLAAFEFPISPDASLLGLRFVTQALLSGCQPGALTNAQDLVLGEY